MTMQQIENEQHRTWADYSNIAADYHVYPNYAEWAVKAVGRAVGCGQRTLVVADIGAGTGKLTKLLAEAGGSGFAVEPNEAMLRQGQQYTKEHGLSFQWSQGTAEHTGLQSSSIDWLCLGSSFHWTDRDAALGECFRILKPGGSVSILWDLRDETRDPHFGQIEKVISNIAPGIGRAPQLIRQMMPDLDLRLGQFGFIDCYSLEASHVAELSPLDYVTAWRAVRDLVAQTSSEQYARVLSSIHTIVQDLPIVPMHMRTYCFTGRKPEAL